VKIIGILLGLLLLAVPLSVDGLTVSEIERKLSQAQTQEDVENVILEVVTSSEYQQACQLLLKQMNSLPPPEKTQAYLDKALPILQDYESLKCRYTENIWGDPPEQLSKTRCNELIVKFEEYNERYWDIDKERQRVFHTDGLEASQEYLETSEWWYLEDLKREIKNDFHQFCLPTPIEECDKMEQEYYALNDKWIELDEKFPNKILEKKLVSTDLQKLKDLRELSCGYHNSLMQYYEAQEKYLNIPQPTMVSSSSEIVCGKGTIENAFGQCVPERATMTTEMQQKSGGGCLIATAVYGSELAPQVQQLREIRDNSLLQTELGSAFMESFNQFYYSFSPGIADLERENPVFKEVVKLTITPLLSSLSLLDYVDLDSEVEVLGYGISLILLNVGMYFVLPAIVIQRIRKFV